MEPLRRVALLLALLVVGACGVDERATGSGSGASGSGGTAGAAGGAAGASGSAGASGRGSGGAAGSGGASGSPGSGGVAGGGGAAGGSGGTAGGSGQTIACAATQCKVPTQICCDHYNQPAQCLAKGAACTYGVPLSCDGPEDCANGQVCCAVLSVQGKNASYVSTSCAATCSGKDARVVCGSGGACPVGGACSTSDILPPYRDCH